MNAGRHVKTVLVALVVALALIPAGRGAPDSNYNGWEDTSGAIMCQGNHSGWQVYNGAWYRCQNDYHPGYGLYFQGWGYVASCPTWYQWCWHWHQL